MANHEPLRSGRLADDRKVEAPFSEDSFGGVGLFGVQHHEHPLLALRQHHFIGAHADLAAGHAVEIEFDAEVAFRAHFDRGGGQAGRTHILNGDDGARGHQLQTGFEQQLFGEGIADLNGRALLLGAGLEGGRSHRRAMDAVAAGLGAEINDRISDACRLGVEDRVRAGDAHRHCIDEDVAVVALVKADRTADGRDAERVAVTADARHHPADETAGPGMLRRTKPQQVQTGDRPRPHGKHVAEDPANARRSPLIGFDERGMVVALHLEDAGVAVAGVDDAGVLSGPLDDPGRLGGQLAQMQARGLVRAVLVPHRGDDAELGKRRNAADQGDETGIFLAREAVCDGQRLIDMRLALAHLARLCYSPRRPHSRAGR